VELSLLAEHQRGYGSLYGALNHGQLDTNALRDLLASLPLSRFDGRIVLTVDVSPWLRSDAACSPERLFCLVHGRNGRSSDHVVPGWPYSFVAALTLDRTSWTQVLDVVRLGPVDDAAAVTADQLRAVVERLIAAGQCQRDDPDILVVMDAGYDVMRLAWVLRDLPVELVGRLRSDRVLRLPKPPRVYAPKGGRPPKHRAEFRLAKPETWPEPAVVTMNDTPRYGKAEARAWDRVHPRLTTARPGSTMTANSPWSRAGLDARGRQRCAHSAFGARPGRPRPRGRAALCPSRCRRTSRLDLCCW